MEKPLRIAVVGAGAAGIVAAYLLQRKHRITLFEQNDYVGGHTNTVMVRGASGEAPVDTGFIVLNNRTYPTFHKFLAQLNVQVRPADMSFGYRCESTNLEYAATGLNGLYAQRGNLLRPSFMRMLLEIRRFGAEATDALVEDRVNGAALADYVAAGGYSQSFVRHYLLPMGAAIWSARDDDMHAFPAETFIRFFNNHGLLDLRNRPQWQTVVGGSHAYVNAFLQTFSGRVEKGCAVSAIRRAGKHVSLRLKNGRRADFDRVVIATHADQALKLLADPSQQEMASLGVWRYQENETVLHSDETVMPASKRAWASWNYRRSADQTGKTPIAISYHMNRLQGLTGQSQYFVTLNHQGDFSRGSVIKAFNYTHPVYTFSALAAQRQLPELNGMRNTYFCGSYFGYGFHEDAVKSAVAVANNFGITL